MHYSKYFHEAFYETDNCYMSIRAKQLESEATSAIEAAKREVERMIIGEGV